MNRLRRAALVLPMAAACGALLPVGRAWAVRREVEDLGISLELPDHWVPIPRAEILEARQRALAAGAAADWTLRAAWQPPPHLRWFTLPHLLLESQPAGDAADSEPAVELLDGRSGSRPVRVHRAEWQRAGVRLRLTLLDFEQRRDEFERWVATLRSVDGAGR